MNNRTVQLKKSIIQYLDLIEFVAVLRIRSCQDDWSHSMTPSWAFLVYGKDCFLGQPYEPLKS